MAASHPREEDALIDIKRAKRKTVTARDLVYSLNRQAKSFYGFGG